MKNPTWFWDRIAQSYDSRSREAAEAVEYARLVERFAEHLAPEHAVLDFACGTGAVSLKVADRVRDVLGIDTSARMIALAEERAREAGVRNVRYSQTILFDDSLGAASFDAILALNVLHLVEDPHAVLRRARELTRPGGVLVVLAPGAADGGLVTRTLTSLPAKLGLLPALHKFRVADVPALVREAGFEIETHAVVDGTPPESFVIGRKT